MAVSHVQLWLAAINERKVNGMAESTDGAFDPVWGAGSISKVIKRSERVTFNLLEKGEIPAKKIGGRWVADRTTLINFFKETAA
ncbi:DNA-binding protein [Fulvimarina sp. MAC3]|uniref:DNA-binding protein n=1 Tax=Fulvimarina sp. MAC3 TaxID=3148887 RepID=UPI0031FD2FF4